MNPLPTKEEIENYKNKVRTCDDTKLLFYYDEELAMQELIALVPDKIRDEKMWKGLAISQDIMKVIKAELIKRGLKGKIID